ncbi:MAG: adenylate/guanylate cyclase domain-containing protein, partial [Dongiaceae bacterium]
AGTMGALKARRKEVLDPLVAMHLGRVFKTSGDGVLVEFASAVNAVQCAVDLQQGMAAANEGQPEDRHVVLRIGVNLGDVMVEGGDLYGDGVNIAARLEALAEPGGVLVSGMAFDHIKSKVKVGFDDLGPQTLKNITEPVRAYRVTGTPTVAVTAPKSASDKPSIAVLPFTNMSGDPEQEYFSDGITEDIITELSRFRQISVMARHSSFQFRDSAGDVKRVGRELGVGYVLEGSIRRTGQRIRITTQLVDASTGNHLWAERYDRALDDIFAVQDEVVRMIVATLFGKVEDAGAQVAKRKRPESLAAYDYLLRGIEHQQRQTKEDLAQARRMLEKAIEIDPELAAGYAYLALVDQGEWDLEGSAALLVQALKNAQKAVALDEDDARCHAILGYVYLWAKNLDKAEYHQLRALDINPNDSHIVAHMGLLSVYLGNVDDGIRWLNQAFRPNPYPPDWYRGFLGMAHYVARDYVQAAKSLNPMIGPFPWDRMYSAASYARLNRMEEARVQLAECRAMRPHGSLLDYAASEPFKNPADLEHLLDGLRKAGLPE